MILRIDDLSKQYHRQKSPALNGISFEVPEHTIFGFLGPNGAGKTTTIKILTGLMQASAGTAYINALPVGVRKTEFRRCIGYLGQTPVFNRRLTGREWLEFSGHLYGMSSGASRKQAAELLRTAGLEAAADNRIRTYSGGMVQRLGIAQALVNCPKLLLLDEPVSALDPIGRKEVLEFILALKSRTTVFMSTHILEDVERICDQVGIINRGQMIALEKTSVLKEQYSASSLAVTFEYEPATVRFMELMQQTPWADTVSQRGEVVIIKHDDYQLCSQTVLGLINKYKLGFSSLQRQCVSLEDIFIQLIGGDHA